MATITYPLPTVIDDAGAVIADAAIAIVGVEDPDGVPVAAHGVVIRQAGAKITVSYDAEAKGEAWIVLAATRSGSTFASLNSDFQVFASRDSSRVNSLYTATQNLIGIVLDGAVAAAPAPTAAGFTVTLTDPWDGVVGDILARRVRFLTGPRNPAEQYIATATKNSTTSLALTFVAAFTAAPVAGDRLMIGL